jgi:hypothetical protein
MSKTNGISIIDERKKKQDKTEDTNFAVSILNFFVFIIFLFLELIMYFGMNGLLLYFCKLGQSNILPTDQNCFPYTDNKPNIEEKKCNIFPNTILNPEYSMKINFPHDEYNLSNKFLDMFREYKNQPDSNFLNNYYISILESVFFFNYEGFNQIFNILNQLPELIIVLFGILIFAFISFWLLIINNFYIAYLWFYNMSWFFKKNNNDGIGKPKWEDVSLISLDFVKAFWLCCFFIFLFFISAGFFPIITIAVFLYCLFSSFSYHFLLNDKKSTLFTIVQNVFKYYKITIMTLFSVLFVTFAFKNLGTMPGVFSLITLGLVYFGLLGITLFKPIDVINLSPIVGYEQAKKTCSKIQKPIPKKNFFLGLFGGGKNITTQLKELNKKINKTK